MEQPLSSRLQRFPEHLSRALCSGGDPHLFHSSHFAAHGPLGQKCSARHSCRPWCLLWLLPPLWSWWAPHFASPSKHRNENLNLHSTAETRVPFGTKFCETLRDKSRWNINSNIKPLPEGALPRASGSLKRAAPLLSCPCLRESGASVFFYTKMLLATLHPRPITQC